jgi:hypothetical protein
MMMTRGDLWNFKTVAILAACAWGCSSGGGGPKTGTAGASSGAAGITGSGGTSGEAGTAGGAGVTGAAGSAGSAGSAGDTGGAGVTGTAGGGASGSAGATTDGSAPDGAAGGGVSSDAGGDVAAGPLKLTSTAFMEGGMIPAQYTCTGAGAHPSPELAWTAGPAATKGYAIVLKDNTNNFTHWAIWDIPPSVMELAMGLPTNTHTLTDPAGAKQVNGGGGIGYLPPCPPSGTHTYVFTLYAQSALPLANAQTTQTPDAIMALLAGHRAGMTTLSAKVTH